jgi:hypothetical protein
MKGETNEPSGPFFSPSLGCPEHTTGSDERAVDISGSTRAPGCGSRAPDVVAHYGLFSPGYRQRLGRLQQQLGPPRTDPLNPTDTGPATIVGDHSPGAPQHPGGEVRCPVCGQAMVVRQILRPSERCPP